ncbi:MAG TPA: hypothetical protein VEN47_13060 [Myxococcota bacterium]|nr:hypothetical protein [Myxococcota bacterium]
MTLRRIAFALVFAGALGLAFLLIMELLVRIFQPQVLPHGIPGLWERDPTISWRHRPGVHVVANTGERDVDVCIDGKGDRVACGVPPRTDCKKRILAIGDSYAEALAVPYDQTVWARIDADTGACTDDSGVAAYYLSQYVVMARQRLAAPGAHYDLVIVSLYLGNDLTDDPDQLPKQQDVQYEPVRLFPDGLSEKAIWKWFYPWNAWLKSHSEFYVAGRYAIRRFMDPGEVGIYGVPDVVLRSKFDKAQRDGTARGLQEIAQAAHAHGARMLVSVVPHVSQVQDPDGSVLLRGLPKLAGDVDMSMSSTEFVPQLQAIPEIDRVVDLLPAMRAKRDQPLTGKYDTHLSPDGHAVWFDAVREPVRELLAEPPPP